MSTSSCGLDHPNIFRNRTVSQALFKPARATDHRLGWPMSDMSFTGLFLDKMKEKEEHMTTLKQIRLQRSLNRKQETRKVRSIISRKLWKSYCPVCKTSDQQTSRQDQRDLQGHPSKPRR